MCLLHKGSQRPQREETREREKKPDLTSNFCQFKVLIGSWNQMRLVSISPCTNVGAWLNPDAKGISEKSWMFHIHMHNATGIMHFNACWNFWRYEHYPSAFVAVGSLAFRMFRWTSSIPWTNWRCLGKTKHNLKMSVNCTGCWVGHTIFLIGSNWIRGKETFRRFAYFSNGPIWRQMTLNCQIPCWA